MAIHPTYLGWQRDWPLFVFRPFNAAGKQWKRGEVFNWLAYHIKPEDVAQLYNAEYVFHNKDLEKQNKVGDRLIEFDRKTIDELIDRLNLLVKEQTITKDQYERTRCRKTQAKDLTRQIGLIKSFLNNNKWVVEDFYTIRDEILDREEAKANRQLASVDPQEEPVTETTE